jgi:opacity protein-like surface antigen
MLHATPALAADWSGLYVGINMSSNTVEMDWTTTETRDDDGDVIIPTSNSQASLESTETGGGILVGYNWNPGPWVFGVDASTGPTEHEDSIDDRIPGLGDSGSDPNSFVDIKTKTDGMALRVRGGYLLTPDLLLYGSFGKSNLDVEITSTCPTDTNVCLGDEAYRNTGTEYANAFGVGLEYAIDSFVLRFQYSGVDFGSTSFTAMPDVEGFSLGADAQIEYAVNIIQLGVAYDF